MTEDQLKDMIYFIEKAASMKNDIVALEQAKLLIDAEIIARLNSSNKDTAIKTTEWEAM